MTADLSKLEELLAAATPAPWCEHTNGTSIWTGAEYLTDLLTEQTMLFGSRVSEGGYHDVALVVELRNDASALLAELKARRPCQHPARIKHGRHEWYVDAMAGAGNCRACGADYVYTGPASVPDVLLALRSLGHDVECGACMSVALTGTGIGEHTCQPHPAICALSELRAALPGLRREHQLTCAAGASFPCTCGADDHNARIDGLMKET